MNYRPWARLATAVGGGVGLALSAPMLAAVGQSSPPAAVLTIGPTARLVAQGAAVAVPVRVVVTCPVGGTANVNVQVAQAIGRDVAHAYGSTTNIRCDGTSQVTEVFATSSDFRFRRGPAFVQANLFACSFSLPPSAPPTNCTAEAHREIQIVGNSPLPTVAPPRPPGPPPVPTTVGPPPGPPGFPFPGLPGFPGFLGLIPFSGNM